jgi:hypothetical protein
MPSQTPARPAATAASRRRSVEQRPRETEADPDERGEREHEQRHRPDELSGHLPEVRQHRAEPELDLAGGISGLEDAAVHDVVEPGHERAEGHDARAPPGERLPRDPGPSGDEGHGDGRDQQGDDIGVADERRALEREEREQADDGAAACGRVRCEQRPEQPAEAGRDERGVRERGHRRAPGEDEGGARRAVEDDGPRAAEPAEPASRARIEAGAAQGAVEERCEPQHVEELEGEGEERIARVLLADPASVGELCPLRDLADLPRERLVLRRRERQMAVGEGDDRGAIREVVRLEQLRRPCEHGDAEAGERGEGDDEIEVLDPLHVSIEHPRGEPTVSRR